MFRDAVTRNEAPDVFLKQVASLPALLASDERGGTFPASATLLFPSRELPRPAVESRLMKTLAAVLALMPALVAQPASLSPRELLALARPLTSTEIAIVLDAARGAFAGKTLRLSWRETAQGPELLMGSDGQPKILRYHGGIIGGTVGGIRADGSPSAPPTTWRDDVTTIIDYTGRLARDCNGSAHYGEMVIE
jgi:hypothetical protein